MVALLVSFTIQIVPFAAVVILTQAVGRGKAIYLACAILGAFAGFAISVAFLARWTHGQGGVGLMVLPFSLLFGVPLGGLVGTGIAWVGTKPRRIATVSIPLLIGLGLGGVADLLTRGPASTFAILGAAAGLVAGVLSAALTEPKAPPRYTP